MRIHLPSLPVALCTVPWETIRQHALRLQLVAAGFQHVEFHEGARTAPHWKGVKRNMLRILETRRPPFLLLEDDARSCRRTAPRSMCVPRRSSPISAERGTAILSMASRSTFRASRSRGCPARSPTCPPASRFTRAVAKAFLAVSGPRPQRKPHQQHHVASHARPLDIATICKASHWVDDMLPRFATLIDVNCSGTVRRRLLLLVPPAAGEHEPLAERLRRQWHSVVVMPFANPYPGRRLLACDELRAGLTAIFGLRELLYIDPDTDVVADLQGIQEIAPEADLLWAANPLPLQPVLDDLSRRGLAGEIGPLHRPLEAVAALCLIRARVVADRRACPACLAT